jgi:hypothetical protein
MGAFLSSVVAVLCFAIYIPLFVIALTTLTKGEVKIRRPVQGGVEIKRIIGYRATIYAIGQFLTWFPVAYAAFLSTRTANIGFLLIGLVFSIAIGYINTQIAYNMKGDVTHLSFAQMGFKFNLQNFAKNRLNMDIDDDEKPKRTSDGFHHADIEDAVFYDVADEKPKNDDKQND